MKAFIEKIELYPERHEDDSEYWSTRELALVLDYTQWRIFQCKHYLNNKVAGTKYTEAD